MILDKVNTPQDVKKLSLEEMNTLATDIRKAILNLRRGFKGKRNNNG